MSIQAHLEQTIKNLEIEKEREVAIIKERVTREKIVPYNQEADKGRDLAIAELQQNMNDDIAARQAQFAKEKQAIFEENEKRKENNANAVLATETYPITGKYDKEIAYLKERVAELKD
jgi:hypothetical protein